LKIFQSSIKRIDYEPNDQHQNIDTDQSNENPVNLFQKYSEEEKKLNQPTNLNDLIIKLTFFFESLAPSFIFLASSLALVDWL